MNGLRGFVAARVRLCFALLFAKGTGSALVGAVWAGAILLCGAVYALPWAADTLPPGCIAWWRADGDFTDSAGGVTAIPAGSPQFSGGVYGQALRLDGASQWLRLSSSGLVRGRSAVTISVWLRPRGKQGGGYTWGHVWFESTASTLNGCDNYTRFSLTVNSGGRVRVAGRDSEDGTVYALESARAIPSNAWTHVAATWKAGVGISLFVNGVLDNALSAPGLGAFTATAANYVLIGASRHAFNNETYNGDVDDLMLFDRALSPADVAWLCDGAWPSGLTTWWRGEEDTTDALGARPGTPVGGLTYTNGPVGRAFSMNGLDAAVALGGWFNLPAFTLSLWVAPADMQVMHADLLDNNHDDVWSWVIQSANNGTTEKSQWFWGSGGRMNMFWLDNNVWQLLTLTVDTNHVVNLYLNGKRQFTDAQAVPIAYSGAQFLHIGKWGPARPEGRFFKGAVDEVMIYDRALAPEEVAFVQARQSRNRLLDIRREGGNFCVSWLATSPLFRLQTVEALSAEGWRNVEEGIQSEGVRSRLLAPADGRRFFRLEDAP